MVTNKERHHSTVHWDFSRVDWELYPDHYVSEPTSINQPGANLTSALCRVAETLCVPIGELRSWIFTDAGAYSWLLFRNQAALGVSNWNNTYIVLIQPTVATLIRRVNSVNSTIGTWVVDLANDTWFHFRVKFWVPDYGAHLNHLAVDLYQEVALEWTKIDSTLFDSQNKWSSETVNRLGIVFYNNRCLDDTEIWGL